MFFSMQEAGLVTSGDCESHTIAATRRFLIGAFRKKLRQRGVVDWFLDRLSQFGTAEFSWNFVRRIGERDDHWATIRAVKTDFGVYVHVLGPQGAGVVDKVNQSLERRPPKKKRNYRRKSTKKRRFAHREHKRQCRLEKAQQCLSQGRRKEKKRKHINPAPFSDIRYQRLTPQFNKNYIFWNEAVTAVATIFRVKSNGKNTAEVRVARALWASLENNGYRFAQYSRRGFSIRLDIVMGRWRNEITPCTIACTKDNAHPTYRLMRKYLSTLFVGKSPEDRARRKFRYEHALRLVA